jgi:hypothetical protein
VTAEARVPDVAEVTACREHLAAALAAVREIAERGGPDFSSLVAEALQGLSDELGGAGALTWSRPGSWDAAAVAALSASLDDGRGVGL